MSSGLWILVLEAACALALLLALVWWTLPKRPTDAKESPQRKDSLPPR